MNHFLNYFTKTEYRRLKTTDDMYEKAQKIVEKTFQGKLDKGGKSYIQHLYFVSDHVDTTEEKIVGLLHGILEDTGITIFDLEEIEFSDEIVASVQLLTRNKTESYSDYIDRIINSNNLTALKVKLVDMENNMDLSRIPNPIQNDVQRDETKYKSQYKRLVKEMERRKKNVRY